MQHMLQVYFGPVRYRFIYYTERWIPLHYRRLWELIPMGIAVIPIPSYVVSLPIPIPIVWRLSGNIIRTAPCWVV